ncbi:Carbon-nitrogen hydrolase [Roseivivax sp. THAF40]|uniref:carbon-nitrogen hydrolase family protein n=1 Tax=unclassified Roseivivax TaxID=2639302 RepID=UPI0012678A98|nr:MULTISPECIES: carbon-nitrogen hydrolase family protein [unclassified Roseivivax]QFS84096.1 Carbon-nitrogen hydrolase [Roseivivax sp. THAF197b]QFT47923.1 Carbon-nitrogen hydrolase [Roseivivax sp. THAF40]
MKIATAAYPMDILPDWAAYATKIGDWVAEAAGQGAELLVFPEYGAMELATLAGLDVAGDLEASLRAVSDRIPDADALHRELAMRHGVHILAASAPVFDASIGPRPVNRARLFTPGGQMGIQDKQIMTRFEREVWGVVPGGPLRLFDTTLGRIGCLICYDGEYPLLGRALAEAELLLVPSCTEALAGYWRVRIGAMARALEAQCITVMASTVGDAPWSEAVDTNCGMGGVFGPPDTGFPPTGVLAEGSLNAPGWTYATVDLGRVAAVRADGVVLNRAHWADQAGRDTAPALQTLR